MDVKSELSQQGWHLTADGLARCEAACQQRNCKITAKNVEKIALDLDLRSIGEQVLSDNVGRNLQHEVEGPLVLQIQRVKNVALPSTKQFSTQSGRRLLRIQLTDGKVSLAAVETEGAIANLSTQTPPGTKVRLIHKVEIQRGFLLLGRNSLKVLGGNVEHLVQKWSLTKMVPDNIGRSTGGTNDAPQFTAFGAAKPSTTTGKGSQPRGRETFHRQSNNRATPAVVSTREAAVGGMAKGDEREKMDLPKSEENFVRKTALQRELQRQDVSHGHSRGGGWSARGDRNSDEGIDVGEEGKRRYPNYRGQQNGRGVVGDNSEYGERGRGRGRGRERGRGGRGDRQGDREDYDQGRKTEGSMLSDWLEQKLVVSSREKVASADTSQPTFSQGQRQSEEDYWAEVWAYEESIAMAESEEQWRREERERRESEKGRRDGRGGRDRGRTNRMARIPQRDDGDRMESRRTKRDWGDTHDRDEGRQKFSNKRKNEDHPLSHNKRYDEERGWKGTGGQEGREGNNCVKEGIRGKSHRIERERREDDSHERRFYHEDRKQHGSSRGAGRKVDDDRRPVQSKDDDTHFKGPQQNSPSLGRHGHDGDASVRTGKTQERSSLSVSGPSGGGEMGRGGVGRGRGVGRENSPSGGGGMGRGGVGRGGGVGRENSPSGGEGMGRGGVGRGEVGRGVGRENSPSGGGGMGRGEVGRGVGRENSPSGGGGMGRGGVGRGRGVGRENSPSGGGGMGRGGVGRGRGVGSDSETVTVAVGAVAGRGRARRQGIPTVQVGRGSGVVQSDKEGRTRGGVGRGRGGGVGGDSGTEGVRTVGRRGGKESDSEDPTFETGPNSEAHEVTDGPPQAQESKRSSETAGQYSWDWVKKGVPLGAKKQHL